MAYALGVADQHAAQDPTARRSSARAAGRPRTRVLQYQGWALVLGLIARAAPTLATSTPSSLSLVERSEPANVASPPESRGETAGLGYPGATRP